MNSGHVAQNRGGSRNFAETQQYLDFNIGPENATTLNTFAAMKSGVKNVDNTGRSGLIPSQKAQKLLDEYKERTQNENSQELDGKVLYSIGGGLPHGHVPIANGVIKKADVLAAAKSSNVRPTNSASYQYVIEENTKLKEINEINLEENSVYHELIMSIFVNLGQKPHAALLSCLANIDAHRHEQWGHHILALTWVMVCIVMRIWVMVCTTIRTWAMMCTVMRTWVMVCTAMRNQMLICAGMMTPIMTSIGLMT